MPLICLLYLFAYLDRINLGNARLQGLPQDVLGGDPTGVLYDWVNSAFYFPYILCPVPAIILSKLCPPRLWFGCAALAWGLCSVLMATAFNFPGLLVARISLGVFEAALSPGVPFYMSLFYTRQEIGLRLATYGGFAAVAGAFGGLLAFGIQHARTTIATWRVLFIIEGIPSILLGVAAIFFLPDRPEETRFLTEEERKVALERMNRGTTADTGRVLQKKHIVMAFKDWRIYAAGVIYFASNCAFGSISAFLPTIITTFGFTNAIAQLLTIPPYAVAATILGITAYMTDRLQSRGLFVATGSLMGAIGYVCVFCRVCAVVSVPLADLHKSRLLLTVTNNHVRYFATFWITSGTYTVNNAIIAWFAHNLGSETKKAAGIPLYMVIGQCGAVLGSHLYPLTDGPRYIIGFSINCALYVLAAVVALVLTVSYRVENRRRDRVYGKADPDAVVDISQLADKAPQFRYTP
ncbi:MFS general substrate transporter [Polyporus arcularius HHB13444]|uniref:MFS general substrate transporter n=1 Tax=Polyporus arcularius HHB13444 TaxID=1314778 RepID=A0A5C3NZE9_9APHY|nr:MFS general substrate transporter [Polyporus arcularius HHB13444]